MFFAPLRGFPIFRFFAFSAPPRLRVKIRFPFLNLTPIFLTRLNEPLLQLDLPGFRKLKSGKVREVFDLGDRLLFVATDRISAFDCIMPNGVPRKGEVLTQISYFWFDQTAALQKNHLLSRADDPLPPNLQPFAAQLARRCMIVKKAQPLAIECVVRGYLAGSGWKEYREHQNRLRPKTPARPRPNPANSPNPSSRRPPKPNPATTKTSPSTKPQKSSAPTSPNKPAPAGLRLYEFARAYARKRGIIIANTKFEFGLL